MVLKIRDIDKKDWRDLKNIYNLWRTENTFAVPENILSDSQARKKTNQLVNDGINLVILNKSTIIGLLEANHGKLPKTKHTIYINQMNILKQYRNQGAGRLLLSKLLNIAKKSRTKLIYLHVVASNLPAITLYKKLGFKVTGKILKEYKFGNKYVDNLIMSKFL